MKQQGREEKHTKRRQTMDRLCSVSGLLLSVVCCIALIHVELRIQEHHRLILHSVTFCDNMEGEIIRKVHEDYGKWQVMATSRHWQKAKGRFLGFTLLIFVTCCGAPVLFCPGMRDILKCSVFPAKPIEYRDRVQWKEK